MPESPLEPLITECPNCHTRFRVNEAQLGKAGGRVRCGACLSVFLATERLVFGTATSERSGAPDADLDELLAELSDTQRESTPRKTGKEEARRVADIPKRVISTVPPHARRASAGPPFAHTSEPAITRGSVTRGGGPQSREDATPQTPSGRSRTLAEAASRTGVESRTRTDTVDGPLSNRIIDLRGESSSDGAMRAPAIEGMPEPHTGGHGGSLNAPSQRECCDGESVEGPRRVVGLAGTSERPALETTVRDQQRTVSVPGSSTVRDQQRKVSVPGSSRASSSASNVTDASTLRVSESAHESIAREAGGDPAILAGDTLASFAAQPEPAEQESIELTALPTPAADETVVAAAATSEFPTQVVTESGSVRRDDHPANPHSVSIPDQLSVSVPDQRASDRLDRRRESRSRGSEAVSTARNTPGPATPLALSLEADLRDERPQRRRWWLPFVLIAAAAGLAGQVLWFQFEEWSRDLRWRPVYDAICARIGCDLPVMRALESIQSRNLVVRSHPDVPGALLVDALIINEAPFAQPFPLIELRFSSLTGSLVAGRRFNPDEYLSGDLEGAQTMQPRTPVHIALEIDDPGADAVNYVMVFR